MNLMVTGAGAPGIMGTLYSLRNNPDGKNVRIVGIDLNADAVGKNIVDAFYQVPGPESEDYLETMLDICSKEKIDIIVPQTTREISFLAKNKKIFEKSGVKVLVANHSAMEIANDKLRTMKVFTKLGLPCPEYFIINDQSSFNSAFEKLSNDGKEPVVIKAPFGNGMRGLRILKDNAWNVERFLTEKPSGVEIDKSDFLKMMGDDKNWPELIVCEYLPGDEYSVDAFIGEKLSLAIPRKRKQIRSGISFVTEIDTNQNEMIEHTIKVANEIGLDGVFGFQYKIAKDGTPKVLECNPRIQGTMIASVLAGANVIWFALKELMSEGVSEMPKVENNLVFRRYWGGVSEVNGELVKI